MLSLGYDEDSPFNSLFGELEGGLLQETGVKGTPYPQDGICGGDLLQELDELAESPLADWLTEKVDFGSLEFQDDGSLIPDSEFNSQLAEMPPVLVNSEVDELQELAVSPADLELLNSLVVNSEVQEEVISDSPKRSKSKLKTASGTKYGKFTDRKSRKRDQNKAAATRYREKKKAEADGIHTEEERLVAKNTSLKEQVDSLTREIQYMKELMVDVYKAKGMI
uniref:Cyclic AMP-dependent transcription factor ATF-5-like n=1 Tax=Saccoglossus kowalevskii TaxID=10224 RepID=A0ABM0M0X5_SACKO|nr:PREDICTED: cyclic AMP-dependent transcription factor ATF-5-like [Saccoglossus kowalevskii]